MEELKKRRKNLKATITRMLTYCQSEQATSEGIISRAEKIDKYFDEFEKVQTDIENLITDSNQLQIEETIRNSVEEKYYEVKAFQVQATDNNKTVISNDHHQIVQAIDTMTQNQSSLNEILQRMSTQQTTSTPIPIAVPEAVIQNMQARLPPIKLPEFDGNYTKWLHFHDLFKALIHDRVQLADVEKFEYLQGHLTGDALSIIKHLTPSSDNYQVAWQLIKNKYENSDQIKRNYLKLLFDQQTMKAASAPELKRILNTTNECMNALKALKEPVESWDSVLLFHLERKIDSESQTLWCRASANNKKFENFMKFLGDRLRELELCNSNDKFEKHRYERKMQSHIHTASFKSCPVCQQNHLLFMCQSFKDLNVHDRREIVLKNKICFNCLQYNHMATTCNKSRCRVCNAKHNTLLHILEENVTGDNGKSTVVGKVNVNSVSVNSDRKITLLPTAVVLLITDSGEYPCRVLLDTGAQANLISENCVQQLGLKRSFDKTVLLGISGTNNTYSRGKVQLTIKSRMSEHSITTQALCLTKLTQQQPVCHIAETEIEYFNNLPLADPSWNKPSNIDVILGANVYSEWALNEHIMNPIKSLGAMSTIFGWVIIGNVEASNSTITIAHMSLDIHDELQKFWQIEEVEVNKQHMSADEQRAEEHYQKTIQRNNEGRYVVRLPFKNKNIKLDNRNQAFKRYINNERKFSYNTELKINYTKFINEYIQLNHMQLLDNFTKPKGYLPHHAVIKTDSTTTKLRVVFDGSAKDLNGNSLNENLLIGPTIQPDVYTILLQFRKHKVALCADIEKMYRQILMHEEDCAYQCIFWRFDDSQEIVTYRLNTVTYGTSAAPFLAIRTLKQIALDYEQQYPAAANLLLNYFYVDDFMASFPNEENAIQLKSDLCKVLLNAGMNLRKFGSNSIQVIQTVNVVDRETSNEAIINDGHTVKTLGLYWETATDHFKFKVVMPDQKAQITKRHVLSTISRIYDPLGFLAPFVVSLKIFMQKIWVKGIAWDTTLPDDLMQQWFKICKNMEQIHNLQIPRWLQFADQGQVQLHGFADASELAYSAVIYLRIINDDGIIMTRLITSKTKVAPVKQISLPRLELCACQLTAKLLKKVSSILMINNLQLYAWTDSKIVLAWLSEIPRKWNNFVANRTANIIDMLPAKYWHHVPSKQNPADLATRGLSPTELQTAKLWWNGPTFLENPIDLQVENFETTSHEQRKKTILQVSIVNKDDIRMYYSDFIKLMRITALILRFAKNCQTNKEQRKIGWLTTKELYNAHNILLKKSQHETYQQEIQLLTKNRPLPNQNKLTTLTPFVDNDGLLRVGGRLENAHISFEQKHPLILDKNDVLTPLIVQHYHIKHLHAGPRQLQYLVSLRYWIPSIIYVTKRCVYKCPTCMRFRNKPFQQQMGNLPKYRFETITAFHNVGIDYAGPIMLRSWKGRGAKRYKCWIALFVCLSTKALHLELVTDLTTDAFLASLRRFVARRGKPANIHSDNGTNFVGCNQKLKDLHQFMLDKTTQDKIVREATNLDIQWHLSPPFGPHFGGMWEEGVKAVKHHLYRTLGNATVTYEEMNTILCQIESCLNSRPLTAKSSEDSDPLTPSHFLIFKSMQTLPDHDYSATNINHLSRWQYLQALVQMFWKRWSIDYLTQLQNRPKWKQKLNNLQKDDLVFVKNELSPPCQWPLGRISATHPGADGLVRVVTVKTQKGEYKRPISKLCPLIIDC